MVFGQNDPAPLSDLSQPVFILGIGRKVVVVDVERSTGLTERGGYAFLPERTIEEEYGLVRPLRRRVRT